MALASLQTKPKLAGTRDYGNPVFTNPALHALFICQVGKMDILKRKFAEECAKQVCFRQGLYAYNWMAAKTGSYGRRRSASLSTCFKAPR